MARWTEPQRTELIEALESGAHRGLRHALQAEPGSASSVSLVEQLTACVSHFRPERHAALVDAVLALHWQQRHKPHAAMPRAVMAFVQELVSATPSFLRQCIAVLTQSFLPAESDEADKQASSKEADEVGPIVHEALEGILKSCPIATDYVFDALKVSFPHKRRDAVAHVAYVAHCIAVLRYSPALLKRVVGLIIARMVELDVEIALQQRQLEDAEAEEEDDPIFEVDLGDNISEELAKMRKNADKLDGMMALMFEFISERCRRSVVVGSFEGMTTGGVLTGNEKLMGGDNESERLLHALLIAFHESLLCTYKCRCVQFLIFFACSFSTRFTSAFTRFLLHQVGNEQIHAEARIASAAYLASFLARASFVPLSTVLPPLKHLLLWAERYQIETISKLGGAPARLDVALHGVFYAVMQGCLYLLCYKNSALGKPEAAGDREVIGELVGRIVKGPLNPLKFCQDAVLIEFERLGVVQGVADIIAANEGVAIDSRDVHGGENRLDDFFPFDPLLLKVSSTYIDPLYQVWAPPPRREERESEKSHFSESASDVSDMVARSLQDMSVTPGGHTPIDDLEVIMRRRLAEQGRLLLHT